MSTLSCCISKISFFENSQYMADFLGFQYRVILDLNRLLFHAVVIFGPEHDFWFKSASTYCDKILENVLLISHLLKFNKQFVIFFAGRKSKLTSYVMDQKEKKTHYYAPMLLRKNWNCLDDMSIYKRFKNLNGSVSITVYTAIFSDLTYAPQ